jgi:hypothetical protein
MKALKPTPFLLGKEPKVCEVGLLHNKTVYKIEKTLSRP